MDIDASPQRGERLNRQDWIDGAILLLAEDNVEALRIDVLAKRLGVTKGSFYWHFKNREALLDAVLEAWREQMTTGIASFINNFPGTPLGRLSRLLRIAISPRPDVPGGPFELTLRDWARRDPKVDAVVKEVDSARLEFLKGLYLDAGMSNTDAEIYAFGQMSYVLGGRLMLFEGTREDLDSRWAVGRSFFVPEDSVIVARSKTAK
jgi:AcrR family transcriptional regulator